MKDEIEQFIEEGKLEEAFSLIKDELSKPLDPKEKGQMYTELISAHIEANNRLDQEYEEDLRKIGQILTEIRDMENDLKKDAIVEMLTK